MLRVQRYAVSEIRVQSPTIHANPFLVEVTGEFRGPGGRVLRIPGFYDGSQTWVVRYSLPATGEWSYRLESPDPGLDGKWGAIRCTGRAEGARGPLRVDPKHPRHFAYEDGTPFFLLGFECDWLWALDARDPETPNLNEFLDLLKARGFNYVVTNVYAHDTTWATGNTNAWDYGPPPLYPWEGTDAQPRFERLNLAFWRHYDRVVEALRRRGMVAHLMLRVYNKMVNWPRNGSPEDWLYYRTIVARYQAYPNVVWDFSKEAHNEKDAGYKVRVLRQVGEWDAYRHPRTVHDDDALYENGTYDFLDYRSDQQHDNWGRVIQRQRERRERPVLNVEYGYERGVESLPTYGVMQDWQEVLRRTWEVITAGGFANYYYSNTSWDLVKWKPEPPGWKRYKVLRSFFEGTRHWELEPHPEMLSAGDGWCLANPEREVVVFQSTAAPFRLTLPRDGEPLRGVWLDPETGAQREGPTLDPGEHEVTPPWSGRMAVLHLRAG